MGRANNPGVGHIAALGGAVHGAEAANLVARLGIEHKDAVAVLRAVVVATVAGGLLYDRVVNNIPPFLLEVVGSGTALGCPLVILIYSQGMSLGFIGGEYASVVPRVAVVDIGGVVVGAVGNEVEAVEVLPALDVVELEVVGACGGHLDECCCGEVVALGALLVEMHEAGGAAVARPEVLAVVNPARDESDIHLFAFGDARHIAVVGLGSGSHFPFAGEGHEAIGVDAVVIVAVVAAYIFVVATHGVVVVAVAAAVAVGFVGVGVADVVVAVVESNEGEAVGLGGGGDEGREHIRLVRIFVGEEFQAFDEEAGGGVLHIVECVAVAILAGGDEVPAAGIVVHAFGSPAQIGVFGVRPVVDAAVGGGAGVADIDGLGEVDVAGILLDVFHGDDAVLDSDHYDIARALGVNVVLGERLVGLHESAVAIGLTVDFDGSSVRCALHDDDVGVGVGDGGGYGRLVEVYGFLDDETVAGVLPEPCVTQILLAAAEVDVVVVVKEEAHGGVVGIGEEDGRVGVLGEACGRHELAGAYIVEIEVFAVGDEGKLLQGILRVEGLVDAILGGARELGGRGAGCGQCTTLATDVVGLACVDVGRLQDIGLHAGEGEEHRSDEEDKFFHRDAMYRLL